jgi:predicted ribosomally synthesized peptide with nif11-like leader
MAKAWYNTIMKLNIRRLHMDNEEKLKELLSDTELTGKFKECASTDEIRALAKEHDLELTDEDASRVFDMFRKLSEDDLNKVAGGCQIAPKLVPLR